MKSARKRIAGLIVGWSFIILGVAGLVLPFLQGVLFILIGLIILSSQYAWARLALAKLRKRFPKTYQAGITGPDRARLRQPIRLLPVFRHPRHRQRGQPAQPVQR